MERTKKPRKVEILNQETVYQGFFRVDHYELRHERFGGGMGPVISREVMERGHSVAVLPYDPIRDEVVLIEQFRAAVHAHDAGADPWLLEIVAGMIEHGEAPHDVARRETLEETGLQVTELRRILSYYASPGGLTEHIDLFCGRVSAADAGGVHGLPDEAEDIKVVVAGFDEAMAKLDRGLIAVSPAVIALQWLALNRDRLRTDWG